MLSSSLHLLQTVIDLVQTQKHNNFTSLNNNIVKRRKQPNSANYDAVTIKQTRQL